MWLWATIDPDNCKTKDNILDAPVLCHLAHLARIKISRCRDGLVVALEFGVVSGEEIPSTNLSIPPHMAVVDN